MEAVLMSPHTMEQSIAPNKQIRITKNQKKNGRGNFIENSDTYSGLLNPPPRAMSLSHPYRQQPPLLPLPNVSTLHHQHNMSMSPLSRSLSSTQGMTSRRKNYRTNKDIKINTMSPTSKKSKPTKREEEAIKKRTTTEYISEFLGPDPKDLPKHLPLVLSSMAVPEKGLGNIDMFSGSVLSPPPSSLPLPKFSLRSKLSCNVEAAADVDAGATHNLRRLLRLR